MQCNLILSNPYLVNDDDFRGKAEGIGIGAAGTAADPVRSKGGGCQLPTPYEQVEHAEAPSAHRRAGKPVHRSGDPAE